MSQRKYVVLLFLLHVTQVTVLCFDFLVLFNLPEVFLSLLLQRCDVTPQGRQVRGGTSSLKEAKITSFKSVEIM